MLAKLTRWLEAGLPVRLPLVTLLKDRQRHQSVGVIGVPAHAAAFQTRRGKLRIADHVASLGAVVQSRLGGIAFLLNAESQRSEPANEVARLMQPVLDSDARYRLEVAVGSEDGQVHVPREGDQDDVDMGHCAASATQLVVGRAELWGHLAVDGPQSDLLQEAVKRSSRGIRSFGLLNCGFEFANHRYARADANALPNFMLDAFTNRRDAPDGRTQVIRVEQIARHQDNPISRRAVSFASFRT